VLIFVVIGGTFRPDIDIFRKNTLGNVIQAG